MKHRKVHTSPKPFKCKQCGEPCRHRGRLFSHYQVHTEKRPTSAMTVENHPGQNPVFSIIAKCTLERSLECSERGKSSTSSSMRKFMPDQSLLNATHVGESSPLITASLNMREFTLWQDIMSARNVAGLLLQLWPF